MTRNRQSVRHKKVWGEIAELGRLLAADKKRSIPKIQDGWMDRLLNLVAPKDHASRSYRYLARKIEEDLPVGRKSRTLIFTSPCPAGLVAETLMMFSYFLQDELDCKVLMVDGTFRQDGLSRRFMSGVYPGFMDLLYGNEGLEPGDLILSTGRKNIFLLPSGNSPKAGFSSLNPEKIKSLIHRLEGEFNYLLIQQGSILRDTRYLPFTSLADRILLLVEEGETRVAELEECQRLFREYKLSNVRLVMSRPR